MERAPLWDIQSKSVGTICTAWRKAHRKLWGLAPLTHGDVIALLSDSLSLLVILKQRFSKYIHKAMNHNSLIIKLLSCPLQTHGQIVAQITVIS